MRTWRKRWLIFSVAIIAGSLGAIWGWTSASFSNPVCKLSQNAAWISVDWTSKPVDKPAIEQLAKRTKSRQIRYLFPYTTYLQPDGSFSPSYDHAQEFVATIREFDPEVRLLAWVGLPLVNQRSIGIQGWVDLSDRETRQKIVDFVAELLSQADFDGVHLNAETVQNNDAGFLLLLQEIRQQLGPDKIISLAGSHWIPDNLNALPFIKDFRWTQTYYREVSRQVNQIATMTYDSHSFHPALYRLWLREQVKGISSSVEGSGVELLIGISVSQEETLSHQPYAENLSSGLAGLCAGLAPNQGVQGVAIYADWDFTPSDWQTWQQWQK